MTELQFKTREDILNEVRPELADAGLTDWSSGSANRTYWEITARLFGEYYYMLQRLLHLFFVDDDSLTGEYLDRRVMERSISRKVGTKSAGKIIVGRSSPAPFTINIPVGTVLSTNDKKVSVQTKAAAAIPAGGTSVTVDVEAINLGKAGNLAPNTVLIETGVAVVGIETIRVDAAGLSGGTDTESDKELKQRFMETIQNPETGGSKRDYERWAKEVTGIVSANCIPMARGAGTVDVVVVSSDGMPSSALLQQVQDHIDDKKPVNADVLVRGPVAVTVNVTLTYYTDSTSSLEPAIQTALQQYINGVGVGGVVRVAQIINTVLDVAEIKDVTVAVPTQNVVLTSDEIAVLGTVTMLKG
ncbi:baseplate J/gp47 family protein [Paenibacillus naphthalenovorans]|uniref:baseplate J/gp47 family protein n=1 Tax=Paenibacillus naphthalenovorans TaxID=162209 RepID=UPI0008889B59|nr:baseplate J/gp47 family protein [Paenibacillus naphthalenovorans]SDI48912.1 Uncharacterized phage protein gp47/JayE [Paenibacillus naphthalenovorans]